MAASRSWTGVGEQTKRKPESVSDANTPTEHNVDEAQDPWHTLTTWHELEHWRQDNQWILSGYRKTSNSYHRSFGSIGQWHNETVNIWSHMIPALLSLPSAWLLYSTLKPRYGRANTNDVIAFGCFFLGAALCLGMSAAYHSISNHSPRVNKIGNKMDYVGIVFLITGSFIPSIYYGFWCHQKLQIVYWTMIASLGVVCTVVSVNEKFRTPLWRPFRAGMFVALGLSAAFPVIHGVILQGIKQMKQQMGLIWLILQGTLYILGAGIYAARIPEKWNPGKYDILGSSHQIFHVLVVIAVVAHLIGLLMAFDYIHGGARAICA